MGVAWNTKINTWGPNPICGLSHSSASNKRTLDRRGAASMCASENMPTSHLSAHCQQCGCVPQFDSTSASLANKDIRWLTWKALLVGSWWLNIYKTSGKNAAHRKRNTRAATGPATKVYWKRSPMRTPPHNGAGAHMTPLPHLFRHYSRFSTKKAQEGSLERCHYCWVWCI